jgi:hypothetical protein
MRVGDEQVSEFWVGVAGNVVVVVELDGVLV